MRKLAIILFLLPGCVFGGKCVHTLYNSLDPYSVSEHLAFHKLYPDTPEGKQALRHAWGLLSGTEQAGSLPLQTPSVKGVVALVNKQPNQEVPILSEEELQTIEKLGKNLPNRKLKGHWVASEEEVLALEPEEVDLARGLFLSQFGEDLQKVRSYEAMLDLMALQIGVRLQKNATPEEKIQEMNRFIFDELGYRFPPHATYAKDIDLYTFLPSVLDSRRGVCLGVSILYICLAQRLNLELEMITPPGHIYVRYRNGEKIINIETTARGIDVESEMYLGIDTRSLQQRNIKEVIGLTYFNQASVYWKDEAYETGLECYRHAEKYLPDDKLLKELMGYNYLFAGEIEKGTKLLEEVRGYLPDHAIKPHHLAEDYLEGRTDVNGIRTVFKSVDENRESILEKKKELEEIVAKYPKFRDGLQSLAITWLQLHRMKEGLEALKQAHALDPEDPTTEYYLAVLNMNRYNYAEAWKHYYNAERIVSARDHFPKALKELKKELVNLSPE